MEAFRGHNLRPSGARPKVQLTPKETLIVSCVTQGMKNKEIALRVGTTEQVVKNYLRKVYDKLGVADRLELALYCLSHHRRRWRQAASDARRRFSGRKRFLFRSNQRRGRSKRFGGLRYVEHSVSRFQFSPTRSNGPDKLS